MKNYMSEHSLHAQRSFSLVSMAFLVFLIAFPFLKLLPLDAEAQPFFIFLLAGYLLFRRRVSLVYFYGYLSITYLFLIGALVYDVGSATKSFIAVLVPVVVMHTFSKLNLIKFSEFMMGMTTLYFCIAIIQQFAPLAVSKLLLGWLTGLIPRMTIEPLTFWDRGISIVASEPSSMIPLLFLSFVCVAYLNYHRILTRSMSYSVMVAIIWMGILTKALTFYVVCAYLVFAYVLFALKSLKISGLVVFGILGFCFLIFAASGGLPSRVDNFLDGAALDMRTFEALNELSGSRIAVTIAPYCNLTMPYQPVPGFGAWSSNFQDVVACLPFDVTATEWMQAIGANTNVKPGSLISMLLLDIGIFALIFVGILIRFLVISFFSSARLQSSWPFVVTLSSCAAIVIGGFPLTLPHFWIAMMIAARWDSAPSKRFSSTQLSHINGQ